MNLKEANKLREVIGLLRHGPGCGWRPTLAARDLGPWLPEEQQRIDDFELWLDTWVLPHLDALIARYYRRPRRNR